MITELIEPALRGEKEAYEKLRDLVYDLIKQRAHKALHGERPGHTLQTTALAHEIWMRLQIGGMEAVRKGGNTVRVKALLGTMIRNYLIEYARRRNARLRAELQHEREVAELDLQVDLSAFAPTTGVVDGAILANALEKLAARDPFAAEVFELRLFTELTWEEIAELKDCGVRKAQMAYKRAQLFLAQETIKEVSLDSHV